MTKRFKSVDMLEHIDLDMHGDRDFVQTCSVAPPRTYVHLFVRTNFVLCRLPGLS